jgi:hypothetical protein
VTGWAALPAAVADEPAEAIRHELHEVRPELTVLDLRRA